MNLYLLSQNINTGYDTYDSCVVAAKNEDSARHISPSLHVEYDWTTPDYVNVKLIGKAIFGTKEGVIISSFNAG